MKLSILICSLHSRAALLSKLMTHLNRQVSNPHHVEILPAIDNKEQTTGAKRQHLLNRAKGDYIVFIDDDDWVPDYYVHEMLMATLSKADCFAINGTMVTDGGNPVEWRISKNYENQDIAVQNVGMVYFRKTNHITAVKRALALQAGFPDKSNAEDKYYSDRVAKLCQTEFTILPPMYEYRFSTKNKEYK